jgi:hypothetical protein
VAQGPRKRGSAARARRKPRTPRRLSFEQVRREALALPRVEEGSSYGTPAFRVAGRLFARLHQDGCSLVLRVDFDARDLLLRRDPEVFYITDHYLEYPMLLVRFAALSREALRELLAQSWLRVAPKRLRALVDSPADRAPRRARPAARSRSR